jgi:hypothetical protein
MSPGATIVLPVGDASDSVASVVVQASQGAYATTYVKPVPGGQATSQGQGDVESAGKKGTKKNVRVNDGGGALKTNDDR